MNPNITYRSQFAEWEAGTAAGLDMWKWEMDEYPVQFKGKVLAWHKLHKLVELNVADAIAKKAKEK